MKKIFTTAILIVAIVLAGCQAGSLSADQIAAKMKAANEKINSYESKMEMTVKMDGQTETTTMQQWMKKPGLMRAEIESPEEGKILSVSDGQKLWTYMEKQNQVRPRRSVVLSKQGRSFVVFICHPILEGKGFLYFNFTLLFW